MGARLAATKLHIPPSAARRPPTFLPFVAVLLLCSASPSQPSRALDFSAHHAAAADASLASAAASSGS